MAEPTQPLPPALAVAAIEHRKLAGIGGREAAAIVRRIVGNDGATPKLEVAAFNSAI